MEYRTIVRDYAVSRRPSDQTSFHDPACYEKAAWDEHTVLPMRDALPKLKDFPTAVGHLPRARLHPKLANRKRRRDIMFGTCRSGKLESRDWSRYEQGRKIMRNE